MHDCKRFLKKSSRVGSDYFFCVELYLFFRKNIFIIIIKLVKMILIYFKQLFNNSIKKHIILSIKFLFSNFSRIQRKKYFINDCLFENKNIQFVLIL